MIDNRSVGCNLSIMKFQPIPNPDANIILIFQKMTERYHRNKAKPANEDIAELVFHVAEEKITITYHTEDTKVSASTREFIKPANADEKGATLILANDMHMTFQVRNNSKCVIWNISTCQTCGIKPHPIKHI